MKKIIFLGLIFFTLSCSIENDQEIDEIISPNDVQTEIEGCSNFTWQFEDKGSITFKNYYDYIEVKMINASSMDVNNLNIHFAEEISQFPRTGKGELNTSKFYYSENLSKGTTEITKTFTFEELGISTGLDILIVAAAEFGSGKSKRMLFATDSELSGSTVYNEYYVEPFINYAGTDQIMEISLSEAIALPSWDEVRKTYAGMLDPGVDKNNGTYNPSIWDIINDFNDPDRASKLGDYTTTYTLGEGECSDSVELTLRVVEDPL